MIPFNKPYFSGRELGYIEQVCHSTTLSGNGEFTKLCHGFFEKKYGFKKALLCTSGTDALEMCAMLCDLQPGDEAVAGEELGMIRFGSRVDVFLPLDAEVEVKINQRTIGKETVLARLK